MFHIVERWWKKATLSHCPINLLQLHTWYVVCKYKKIVQARVLLQYQFVPIHLRHTGIMKKKEKIFYNHMLCVLIKIPNIYFFWQSSVTCFTLFPFCFGVFRCLYVRCSNDTKHIFMSCMYDSRQTKRVLGKLLYDIKYRKWRQTHENSPEKSQIGKTKAHHTNKVILCSIHIYVCHVVYKNLLSRKYYVDYTVKCYTRIWYVYIHSTTWLHILYWNGT